ERNTRPAADGAPALDAVVTGDLASGGKPAKLRDAQAERMRHQSVDLQSPVREALDDLAVVPLASGIEGPVGLEVGRYVRRLELLRHRIPPEQQSLRRAGPRLSCGEHPLEAGALGEGIGLEDLAAAAEQQTAACEPADERLPPRDDRHVRRAPGERCTDRSASI